MVIGITGKYCSGKSTITRYLQNKGYHIISVDEIAHKGLTLCSDTLIEKFGTDICDLPPTSNYASQHLPSNVVINRRKLGNIVFSSKEKLKELESIIHPYVIKEVENTVNTAGLWVIDAALLHHLGLHTLCSLIFIVHSNSIIRFFRALKRDRLSPLQIIQRFRSQTQIPDKHYFKNKKKPLNLNTESSEILVSGTCSFLARAKMLDDIIDGVENGRKNSTKQS